MDTQIHKESINRLKDEERKKFIYKTSALICNEKDACMRCARICHFFVSQGQAIYWPPRAGGNDGQRKDLYGRYKPFRKVCCWILLNI